jgi:hypothetical protein
VHLGGGQGQLVAVVHDPFVGARAAVGHDLAGLAMHEHNLEVEPPSLPIASKAARGRMSGPTSTGMLRRSTFTILMAPS